MTKSNSSSPTDPKNEKYWADYSNLQTVKHDLIRRYLNGWYPKLGYWAGRVVYLDTHAGRGKHETGQPGSPVVAVRTLLEHSHRDRLLAKSEFLFLLIERDEDNFKALRTEIEVLDTLPAKVKVTAVQAEAFAEIKKLVDQLKVKGQKLAPAFVFVDPFGFRIPGSILREVMKAGRVELFINVMWRELDMAIRQTNRPVGLTQLLNEYFDGEEWTTEISAAGTDQRAGQAVALLARKLEAKWSTWIRMNDNGRTRYVLLHLTNHDDGRDLMKECLWAICPTGEFLAHKSADSQPFLIEPEPDLTPVREWVLARLKKRAERWLQLLEEIRPDIWLPKHVTEVVRSLRKEAIIEGTDYRISFNPKNNPLLKLKT